MKTLRQLCVTLTLTLALSVAAYAGEIHTTVAPPPPAPAATTADGQIETPVAGQEETGSSEATATDSAAEIALNLLQSVLSLF